MCDVAHEERMENRMKMDLNLFGEDENRIIEKLGEMKSDFQMDDNDLLLEVAKLTQLNRIADSLEKISDYLDSFNGCVGYAPPTPFQKEGYNFFRIGGNVYTDQY